MVRMPPVNGDYQGLVDHTGKPMSSRDLLRARKDPFDFPVPPYSLFTATQSGYRHTYWHSRFDEALRHQRQNALSMWVDPFLQSLLQERKLAVANLPWHLEVEDERQPRQREVRDALAAALRRTPRLKQLFLTLLNTTWYGRYGCEWDWHPEHVAGRRVPCIMEWSPVNGDKFGFFYRDVADDAPANIRDGTPYVLINATAAMRFKGKPDVFPSTEGMALALRGGWREWFCLHLHNPEDADYFDPEGAVSKFGVGLRSHCYWYWWMKAEFLEWISSFMERVGLGVTIWYYESGNSQSLAAVQTAARDQSRRDNLFVPYTPGQKVPSNGLVERIEPPITGVESLRGLIEYFDDTLRQLFNGQTLSSKSEGSGLGGTGVASLHSDTKSKIAAMDAADLGETFTGSARRPGPLYTMQKYAFPDTMPGTKNGFTVRLMFDVERAESKDKLDAARTIFDMGGTLKESEVMAAAGFSRPAEGEASLSQMKMQQQQMQQQMEQQQQQMQMPGMGMGGVPGQEGEASPSPDQEGAAAGASGQPAAPGGGASGDQGQGEETGSFLQGLLADAGQTTEEPGAGSFLARLRQEGDEAQQSARDAQSVNYEWVPLPPGPRGGHSWQWHDPKTGIPGSIRHGKAPVSAPRPAAKPPPLPPMKRAAAQPPPLPRRAGAQPPPLPSRGGAKPPPLLDVGKQAAAAKPPPLPAVAAMGAAKKQAAPGEASTSGGNAGQPSEWHAYLARSYQATLENQPQLSPEQRQEYARDIGRAISGLPRAAVIRIAHSVKTVQWYGDARTLTEEVTRRSRSLRRQFNRKDSVALGAFFPVRGELHLDGGGMKGLFASSHSIESPPEQVYAHELWHAATVGIDTSPAWVDAWRQEIGDNAPPPGRNNYTVDSYATTSSREGMAEFGRFLTAVKIPRTTLEKRFPKCVAVLKAHGLWDDSPGDPQAVQALDTDAMARNIAVPEDAGAGAAAAQAKSPDAPLLAVGKRKRGKAGKEWSAEDLVTEALRPAMQQAGFRTSDFSDEERDDIQNFILHHPDLKNDIELARMDAEQENLDALQRVTDAMAEHITKNYAAPEEETPDTAADNETPGAEASPSPARRNFSQDELAGLWRDDAVAEATTSDRTAVPNTRYRVVPSYLGEPGNSEQDGYDIEYLGGDQEDDPPQNHYWHREGHADTAEEAINRMHTSIRLSEDQADEDAREREERDRRIEPLLSKDPATLQTWERELVADLKKRRGMR
jgi:phage gp29-like protein